MRTFVSAVLAFAAFEALAFDSVEWLGKRELFAREAERLRAAYSNCLARVESPAEGVMVPIETFDDGSVKTSVTAKKSQFFLDSGFVWGEGVTIMKFKPDGTLEGRIDAEHCVVDRHSRSGWAEGKAKLVHDQTTFSGEDVYFSSPDSYVRVFRNSDVESKNLKFGGLRP